MSRARSVATLAVLGLVLGTACSGPSGNDVFVPGVPTQTDFPAVADMLGTRCGTLDCHGSSARNLRIYNLDGVRLPPSVTGQGATTDAEYQATYLSLVTIQPEVLTRILSEHGARPERWIVMTKGRGAEHHKGGQRLQVGDDGDRCLTSWLTGTVDAMACGRGSIVEPTGGFGF